MAHSFSNLLAHVVFSTRNRKNLLADDILPEMRRVVGGIVRNRDGKLLAMNGLPDHVHLLIATHPKIAMSDLIRDVKANSSGWVHERFPDQADFGWQTGYGAFSVSQSNSDAVADYIDKQPQHHRQRTFEEEFVELLKRHGIEFDMATVFESELA